MDSSIFKLRKSSALILLYPCPYTKQGPAQSKQTGVQYKTLILKRKSTMSFSNTFVFPGGACDPQDSKLAHSSKFEKYSKITAVRQFLQQTGLLLYPIKQSQKQILFDRNFLHKSIKQISNELDRIWSADSLDYIQSVLRLMTPQQQKGKRFDCIFQLCRIGEKIGVINIQLINHQMKNSLTDQQIRRLTMNSSNLNQSQLLYDRNQSDDYIFDTPVRIMQRFKSNKILLIPPQIILFTGLIRLCSLSQKTNSFPTLNIHIEPIMFQFDFKTRRFYILGDHHYNYHLILKRQPDSESKLQFKQYIESRHKQLQASHRIGTTIQKMSRYICFGQQANYISNWQVSEAQKGFLQYICQKNIGDFEQQGQLEQQKINPKL